MSYNLKFRFTAGEQMSDSDADSIAIPKRRAQTSRSHSPAPQLRPCSAAVPAWEPRSSEVFNVRGPQSASLAASTTQLAESDNRWALASAALDLPHSEIQRHAALIDVLANRPREPTSARRRVLQIVPSELGCAFTTTAPRCVARG